MIVAIATPSAQAVVAATKEIPVVYSAVTDPVAAKLVKTWDASGTNVTGVSDLSPLAKHLELIKKIAPNAKRVGVIYSPGEANSVAIIEALKKAMPAAGLTLVEGAAARTVDVPSAAQSLVGKADVIYAPDRQQRDVGLRGHRQGGAAGEAAGRRRRHRRRQARRRRCAGPQLLRPRPPDRQDGRARPQRRGARQDRLAESATPSSCTSTRLRRRSRASTLPEELVKTAKVVVK